MNNINKKLKIIYEIIMIILAIIVVTIVFLDLSNKVSLESNTTLYLIDTSILIVFIIDYFVRLFLSENKKQFFKSNIIDMIAIMPFSSLFRAFRVLRIFRVLRMTKFIKVVRVFRFFVFIKKFTNKIKRFINTNGFIYVLYLTIVTILLGAVGIYFTEKNITVNSFADALWWSFVTATTVGYGDISPSTGLGRLIAAILMLIGIGFIGMLTGTIATYFLDKTKEDKIYNAEVVSTLNVSDLSQEEIEEIQKFIHYIKNRAK